MGRYIGCVVLEKFYSEVFAVYSCKNYFKSHSSMTSLSCKFDTAHRDVIHDARLNFYGNRLATCSSDRTIKVFEVKTNGQSYPLAELTGHSGPVWQVSWAHPQFNGVLASASYDKSVIIWNECDGKWQKWYEWKDHEASVNSVAFGPHQYGLVLATASADSNIAILSYNAVSGQWSSKLIIKAHEQGVNSVSWAPIVLTEDDGDSHKFTKRIVSCGNDKFVKIWVEQDGEWICEQTLGAHTDFVKDVSWCPVVFHETHTIVSCGQDRSVYIWRCKDIKSKDWIPKLLEKAEGSLWHVNWSLCGTMLSVSGEDNKIAVWKEDLSRQWKRISDGEN